MNETSANTVKILAVEDDAGDYGLMRVYLRMAGYGMDVENDTVVWAMSLAEAKEKTCQFRPDLVLLDLNLLDSCGIDTVIEIRKILPGTPVIVLTGNDDKELAIAALHKGASDYVVKGHYEHDALGKAIRHALVRAQLEAQLRLFEVALNSAANGILITDADACIQWANPAFTQLTGYSLDEAIGHTPSELIRSGMQEQAFYKNMWDTILSGNNWHGEIINRHKNGTLYSEALSIAPIVDKQKKVTNFVAIKQDITARINYEKTIVNMASHDALTRLPNRRLLNDRLSHAMASSKRSGCYGALMFLDLDKFKPLNDTHGHAVGDLLLIEVADRLKSCVREADTVARFGGDEFVVMLSEVSSDKAESTSQANIVAEKILASLSAPYRLPVKDNMFIEHRCTASIGVIMFINHELSQGDLLKCADMAMYQAKEAGRNQIRFYGQVT